MSDYPNEEDLETIRTWKGSHKALMEFIEGIWWAADWGFSEGDDNKYYLSTGGWSGNEEIIGAMIENYVFWGICWDLSRKGGHHEFTVKR